MQQAENRRSDGLESLSGEDILSSNEVHEVHEVPKESGKALDGFIYHSFILPSLSSRFSPNHHKQQTGTSKPETADKSNKAEVIEETSKPKIEQTAKEKTVNGLEEARRRLEEAVSQLEPEVKTFLDTYRVDDSGYSCIRCKCGASFFSAEDFESHVRFGACTARKCECGTRWLTLSELLTHCEKTNCRVNPVPDPPPERKTRRRWRRLHGNGDLVLGGDE
jgi:hypothetical protein